MADRIITYSFYLLFFLTPLFWTSYNFELFEYNKMILTYALTVVIVGAWIFKMVESRTLIFKRTPLDIPLLLFLGANILSTIFSIDPHTSIWGYYSRSNGGLISIVSYLLLYFAFVSNFEKQKIFILLKIGLISGFLIALWAIFEHFGVSLSCAILRQQLNASCWVQDVQARVFATLGQPNWLAAYLSMLIFPALYFFLTEKRKFIYFCLLITLYLAFTFTYSRGPTLGLIGGMIVFVGFYLRSHPLRPLAIVLVSFLSVNILFGSALTSLRLVNKFAAPTRPAISIPAPSIGTQLENGGTESGAIRFIVWEGAVDIFKHYPFFGSGVETFAYSYYQFRPQKHNLTSEWDFLYNKAHNEYLNYLATTGIVGFTAYMLVIGTFLWWSIKRILESSRQSLDSRLLILVTLSAYVSYLIYNIFLFSVVIIAIFFYLFPAVVFVYTNSLKNLKFKSSILSWIYKRPLYENGVKAIVVFLTLCFLYSISQIWRADTLFSKGEKASDSGNSGRAYNFLSAASEINTGEPFYRSELGYAAAAAAAVLHKSDATLSAALKDEAIIQTNLTLKGSPMNVSFWRTAIRTYFELGTLDPKYIEETLKALEKAILLAPTDPKLYYNKALILDSQEKKEETIKALQKALELKPNYLEAIHQLEELKTKLDEIN